MVWILGWMACHDGPDVYEPCESPATCEAPPDQTAECVNGDGDGFCTWSCEDEADCAQSEHPWQFVCASFESSDGNHCFPACDGAEAPDEEQCPRGYECRSTGGGSENEKVCYPG